MTAESQKGKQLEELAREYSETKGSLDKSASLEETIRLLAEYNNLIHSLKKYGITVETPSAAYLEKATNNLAERLHESMDSAKTEDWEKARELFSKNPDAYFKSLTKSHANFSHYEEDTAVFAPKTTLAGRCKCAIKVYSDGEISLGMINSNKFEPIHMDKCEYAPSETIWLSDIINWAKRYKRLL